IPAYVKSMLDYWLEQKKKNTVPPVPITDAISDKTSPHILAERKVRLARGQLMEMKLHVHEGGELDDDIAKKIATAFGKEVSNAYYAGRERLTGIHQKAKEKYEKELAEQNKPKPPAPKKPKAKVPALTPGAKSLGAEAPGGSGTPAEATP